MERQEKIRAEEIAKDRRVAQEGSPTRSERHNLLGRSTLVAACQEQEERQALMARYEEAGSALWGW